MILDGKACAQELRQQLRMLIEQHNLQLTLCIINVGNDPASQVYIKNKEKACQELGITCIIKHFDDTVSEEVIVEYINHMNDLDYISGIMVQLPLPRKYNTETIINSIHPAKDVDGLTYEQTGRLWQNAYTLLPSCTPSGIIHLLRYNDIDIRGKHCVIIGRSNIVGKPLAGLMLNEDATVTICHSKTKNLKEITKMADILIVAIGKPKFITSEYIKDNAIVIDVGINRVDGKLCGDVDFENVKDKCSWITPVPGGVGPMTVCSLLMNTIDTARPY